MKVSYSQISQFQRCPKQWWFRYGPLKLKEPAKPAPAKGTVLHNVVERWLRADDNGIDAATGCPVDLYPKGWETADGYTMTAEEQQRCQELVHQAISTGILYRAPGRKIEHEFTTQLVEDIKITGKIDVLTPTTIIDHKTSKDRKYCKTRESLASDQQMLLYSKYVLDNHRTGPNNGVAVRHNQFVWNPCSRDTFAVDAVCEPKPVEKAWAEAKATALQMRAAKEAKSHDQLYGPIEPGACDKFGGCPYKNVCFGIDTPESFAHDAESQVRKTQSVLDFMSQQPPTQPVAASPGAINGSQTPPFVGTDPKTCQITELQRLIRHPHAMPWYYPGCPECSTNPVPGMNAQVNAVCTSCQNAQYGRSGESITPQHFDRAIVGADGVLTVNPLEAQYLDYFKQVLAWRETPPAYHPFAQEPKPVAIPTFPPAQQPVAPPGAAAPPAAPPAAQPPQAAPPVQQPVAAPPPAAPAAQPPQASPPAAPPAQPAEVPAVPVAAPTQAPATAADEAKGTKGRPKGKAQVYINCFPHKVSGKVHTWAEFYNEHAQAFAEAVGAACFEHVGPDAFGRRDHFKAYLRPVFESLGTVKIAGRVPNGDPDLVVFCELLCEYAGQVTVGCN